MLWSGSLLKGGLNIPYFPLGPRCNGRVGQKMACKFFSIRTYDYIRNTCLHYIDELELVLCHPRLWLLHDEPHPALFSITDPLPTSFPYIVLRLFTFSLLFLSSLQNTKNIAFTTVTFCYRYHYYNITLLLNTLLQILSFQVWLNWQLSC